MKLSIVDLKLTYKSIKLATKIMKLYIIKAFNINYLQFVYTILVKTF